MEKAVCDASLARGFNGGTEGTFGRYAYQHLGVWLELPFGHQRLSLRKGHFQSANTGPRPFTYTIDKVRRC